MAPGGQPGNSPYLQVAAVGKQHSYSRPRAQTEAIHLDRPAINRSNGAGSSIEVVKTSIGSRYDLRKPYEACRNATPEKVSFYARCLPQRN